MLSESLLKIYTIILKQSKPAVYLRANISSRKKDVHNVTQTSTHECLGCTLWILYKEAVVFHTLTIAIQTKEMSLECILCISAIDVEIKRVDLRDVKTLVLFLTLETALSKANNIILVSF